MRVDANFYGTVPMPDAGNDGPAPVDRRYGSDDFLACYDHLTHWATTMDRLGYDTMWLTEHHFQYEGYEVIPNGLLIGSVLAERTERIRIGMAFNVVPQWHPLKLAEDFATLHNLSGGRGILGVGRGTVPREAEPLGTKIGSFDNPDQVAADEVNRKMFDEAMQVIRLALDNESFSFHGDVYDFPPPGIPDRGGFVEELTLVPQPLYPYEIWQAITSPPSLEQVPRAGWGGVFWNCHHSFIKMRWEKFAEIYEATHGRALDHGEKRMLVLNTCVEDTREQAIESVRDGHDEFWKFLGPYGWSKGYMGDDGKPARPGLIPTLEDSMDRQRTWVVGSPDEVAETIAWYRDEIGIEDLMIFPAMPGDSYAKVDEQLHRLAEQVLPQVT